MAAESDVKIGKFDILATYSYAKALLDGAGAGNPAFPYVTLVESTGSGKLDASVQGAAVSAERAEPT